MLGPGRIAGALLVAVVVGLGVGFGVHELTAGTVAIPHTEAVILIDRRGYERSACLYPCRQRFATHDPAALGQTRGGWA